MPAKQVAVRLGVDGSAEFKRDFADASQSAQDSLNKVGQATDAVASRAEAAAARQQAAWKRMADAAKAAETASRSQFAFNAGYAPGLNGASAGAARDSASVFEAHLRDMDQAAARAEKLRAQIDPLSAAQTAFAAATRNADDLLARGAISSAEHAAAMKIAKGGLEEAEKAAQRLAGGAGLSTMQLNVLMGAAHHTADALIAGANPMRILAVEAAKAAPAMGGLGAMARIAGGFIFSAGGAAVAAAGLFALGAKATLDYDASFRRLEAAASGFGRRWGTTGAALEASAEQGARAAHISVGAAREMETGFLHAGTISTDVFAGLIGMSRDFAVATGQDVKSAGKELTKAFADPAKGARDLNEQLGFLTAGELRNIEVLAQQADKTNAQKALMDALARATQGAEARMDGFSRALDTLGAKASEAYVEVGQLFARLLHGPGLQGELDQRIAARATFSDDAIGRRLRKENEDQIARLQKAIADQAKNAGAAKDNIFAQNASDLAFADTGQSSFEALKARQKTLQAGLKGVLTGGDDEQVKRTEQDLNRTANAIKTWMDPEEKRLQLLELDAKLGRERDPATRGRLAYQKALIESSGELKTREEQLLEARYAQEQAEGRADRRLDRRAETLARELASMRANAAASLAVADAYQESASAGEVAEARRTALTDATRKGADVDAFVAAQLQVNIGQAAANGAKTLAQLSDETDARRALNDQVLAGKLDANDVAEELKAEQATRLLVAAAAHAEGEAKQKLLQIADALKDAEADANDEAKRSAVQQATSNANDQVELLRKELSLISATNRERAVQIAQFRTLKDLADQHVDPNSPTGRARLASAAGEANAGADLAQGQLTFNARRDQDFQLQTIAAEQSALGKTEAQRQAILSDLRIEQDLKKAGVDLTTSEGQALESELQARQRLIDEAQRDYARQKAGIDELKSTADGLVDTLGNALEPQNWRRWHDLGKELLADLEKEFIKLALLNPLKNAISGGGNLPTLANVFGGGDGNGFNLMSLFGQGGGGAGASADAGNAVLAAISSGLPGFAGGTDDAPGGWSMVGESGPEPMWVPRGSKILNHASAEAAFRDALNGGGRAGTGAITFDMRGAITTPELLAQVNQIAADHAARGTRAAIKTSQRNTASWQARSSVEKG